MLQLNPGQPAGGPGSASPRAIAVVSVHASPLVELGAGENGGMNLAIRRLCEGLSARGVPTDVFTRRDQRDAPAEELIAPGSRLVRLEAGPAEPLPKTDLLRHLPAFATALLAHARSERRTYRALHAHYWLSGWVARRAAPAWQVPWIQSFHTLARVKEHAGLPSDPQRAAVESLLARSADRLVVHSSAEERDLCRLYGAAADRVCVVPLGVDLAAFDPRPLRPMREKLGVTAHQRVVLSAGRLEPLKGTDLLLRAMAHLAGQTDLDDVVTLVVGGNSGDGRVQAAHPGGEAGRLAALAAELGIADRVRFLGALPHGDLATLYRIADLCVMPSLTESFGLVALEAQASGTPVVATAVGGLVDVIDDATTGFLVQRRTPSALAAPIARLLRDQPLRRRMGHAARRRAESFSWEGSVERLATVYDCADGEATVPLAQCSCS